MAFVLDKFIVTFALSGVMDMEGAKTVEFLPVGADIASQRAQLDTDIAGWLTAFNNTNTRDTGVSNAWVTGYTVTEKWYETDNIPAFTMDDNILVEALVGATLEGGTDKASITIPAPTVDVFGGSYNNQAIDLEDAILEAYATLYSDGGGNCALSDGEQWQFPINLQYGRVKTRKAPRR